MVLTLPSGTTQLLTNARCGITQLVGSSQKHAMIVTFLNSLKVPHATVGVNGNVVSVVVPLLLLCRLFAVSFNLADTHSSHTPSRYDPKQHAIVWDDSMCFPVRYRDLDRNSQLVS